MGELGSKARVVGQSDPRCKPCTTTLLEHSWRSYSHGSQWLFLIWQQNKVQEQMHESIDLSRWEEFCAWKLQTRGKKNLSHLLLLRLAVRGPALVAHLAWEWLQSTSNFTSLICSQLEDCWTMGLWETPNWCVLRSQDKGVLYCEALVAVSLNLLFHLYDEHIM